MSDFSRFNAEELAANESFREWVFRPNPENDLFWKEWQMANPEKRNDVLQAQTLLLTLKERYDDGLSDIIIGQDIRKLVSIAEDTLHNNSRIGRSFRWPLILRIAAVLILSICGTWLYNGRKLGKELSNNGQVTQNASTKLIHKVNNTQLEMTVLLSDNSVITLMKGSKITYPTHFALHERKVILAGEAFFDIAKDAKRPFLVYANETVTKVLGTSFRIKAIETDQDVMVVVKTGKVSVFPQKDYESLSNVNGRETSGVVLTPNQQVVFSKRDNRLEKGAVANPGLLSILGDQELVFDDTPVSEILNSLEKTYGIEIAYDPQTLSSCSISTQFKEENLKERLNAICLAIGATYEINEGKIYMESKGCAL